MLSGPAIPHLPKDSDELRDALLSKKRQADTLDNKVPIFSLAVGHRRDISWEEKREADFSEKFDEVDKCGLGMACRVGSV